MGNRAVITSRKNFENNGIGIYLHWNGGRDSVEAFLAYCKLKGYRAPTDDNYGWARLTQVIANFFGGTTSIGIDTIDHLDCDNGDNGVYIIDGWEIVGREYFEWDEQDGYDLNEFLAAIDERQPENEQLGAYITAPEVSVSELKVGDTVYIRRWNDEIKKVTILGFGEDKIVNGSRVKGLPFAEIVSASTDNPNNYIHDTTVRKAV